MGCLARARQGLLGYRDKSRYPGVPRGSDEVPARRLGAARDLDRLPSLPDCKFSRASHYNLDWAKATYPWGLFIPAHEAPAGRRELCRAAYWHVRAYGHCIARSLCKCWCWWRLADPMDISFGPGPSFDFAVKPAARRQGRRRTRPCTRIGASVLELRIVSDTQIRGLTAAALASSLVQQTPRTEWCSPCSLTAKSK